jgi:small subunit ribosomal protein S4
MANYIGARARLERRYKKELALFSGVTPESAKFKQNVPPGEHGEKGGKPSQFAIQFGEKQAAKYMYGVLERQFRNYYKKAKLLVGSTGENLLRLLERRLDNVVYLIGFARTRREARQLVSHRGIMVRRNGVEWCIDRPSFQARVGDEIIIKEKAQKQLRIQEGMELAKQRGIPEWLEVEYPKFMATIKRLPERDEMPQNINELLIVELYSK